MTWCYAWSTAPTLKSTFNAARTALAKEILIDTWTWGGRKRGGEKSPGREGHENPICSISLRSCGCIDECPGWIIKVFYSISGRELHAFHSETRHSVSFWYKLEMPAHKAGRLPKQRSPVPTVEISALLMPITLHIYVTNKAFSSHCAD